MDFWYFLALPQGYLEPISQGASCRENNLRAGNVSSLWRALARTPFEIFPKFLFLQNPWVYASKSCSYHFSLWPSGGSTNWKMRFSRFSKKPTLTQFYAIFSLINVQKYFAWLSFRSFPATMAIFSQIGDIKVTLCSEMVDSLMHPLLKGPSACKCFNFLIICRYFGLKWKLSMLSFIAV